MIERGVETVFALYDRGRQCISYRSYLHLTPLPVSMNHPPEQVHTEQM